MPPKKIKRAIPHLDIAEVANLVWIIATSDATPWQRHEARKKLEAMGGRLPLSKQELANPYTPDDGFDPFDDRGDDDDANDFSDFDPPKGI